MLLAVLADDRADTSDRILAAELAGDFTVINDNLVDALLSVLQRGEQSDELRGKAAISLGPVLEHADTDGFDYPDDVPITEATFDRIQNSLRKLYFDADVPTNHVGRSWRHRFVHPRAGTKMLSVRLTAVMTRTGS